MGNTVADIIADARAIYYCDTTQISDAQMLRYVNNIYHDIENEIVQFDSEDYFYQTWYANTVPYQNRYIVPNQNVGGFKKIRNVYVRYGVNPTDSDYPMTGIAGNAVVSYGGSIAGYILPDDIITFTDDIGTVRTNIVIAVDVVANTFTLDTVLQAPVTSKDFTYSRSSYKVAELTTTSNLEEDPNTLRETQDESEPMYRLIGDYIEIFPRPTVATYYGIKMEGIVDLSDLTLTSTQTDIKLKRQYHNVITKGLGQRIYQTRGMLNEKNDAKAEYEKEKNDLLREYSDRVLSPIVGSNPSLVNFE